MQIARQDPKLRASRRPKIMAAVPAIGGREPTINFLPPIVSASMRYLCSKGRYRATAFVKGVRVSR